MELESASVPARACPEMHGNPGAPSRHSSNQVKCLNKGDFGGNIIFTGIGK